MAKTHYLQFFNPIYDFLYFLVDQEHDYTEKKLTQKIEDLKQKIVTEFGQVLLESKLPATQNERNKLRI